MKIGCISDIHFEFGPRPIEFPDMDILVLPGDVHTDPVGVREVLESIRRDIGIGIPILYVLGNHEYYANMFPGVLDKYRKQTHRVDGVTLLEKDEYFFRGVRFLGTTLWSDLSDQMDAYHAKRNLNDFHMIKVMGRAFNPEDATREWKECKTWLESKLAEDFEGPTVVITHHSPSSSTCPLKYRTSNIRHCFHSNMEDMILKYAPKLWIYGHDHISGIFKVGGTYIVSVQRGYPRESGPTIEVETIDIGDCYGE